MTLILGLSAFYHDSAAALLRDGEIIAAAQEERFTRKKHDPGFPKHAVDYCLQEAGITLADIDHVAFYDKPFLKFERLLETYLAMAPSGLKSFRRSMPVWLKEKLFLKKVITDFLGEHDGGFTDPDRLLFAEHHFSHAASAFYPSPFDEAVVLTIDGVGEWATTTVAIGSGRDLTIKKEQHFPHSLGLLYSAVTYYTGFQVNSGEYKVMGLAPYGEPRYRNVMLDKLVDVRPDGSFVLDQTYFDYCTGLTMVNEKFADLFGRPVRGRDEDLIEQFHMDMAASVQAVVEEIMLRMTRSLASEYGIDNLCLAGGVALNCVANGKVLRDGAFRNIWIQPAAGDAGGSVGAALAAWHWELGNERKVTRRDAMHGAYLGPTYDTSAITAEFDQLEAVYDVLDDAAAIERAAEALAAGKVVGWFNGRMEFGPRALGGRSIIADPRLPQMQKALNLKVKFRESFRPFAPSVLAEDVSDWFELEGDSPYMLLVADVREDRRRRMTDAEQQLFGIDKLNIVRSEIPAVTHVDYSARIQTVHEDTNPRYHALLKRFKAKTGCSVLVNTSFNVRGEPIVCTPTDAFRCFMGTGIDILVCNNVWLDKAAQTVESQSYEEMFELD